MRVLSTKKKLFNTAQIADLRALGVHVQTHVFIRIEHDIDSDTKHALQTLMHTHNAQVIITSQHAARSMEKHFSDTARAEVRWNIFCIGYKTTALCARVFPRSVCELVGDDSTQFVHYFKLPRTQQRSNLYLLRGSRNRSTITDFLHSKRLRCNHYLVYHNTFAPARIDPSTYDVLLFCSPSAVESFFIENPVQEVAQKKYVCIGRTTGSTLLHYLPSCVPYYPEKPCAEDLVKVLLQLKREVCDA